MKKHLNNIIHKITYIYLIITFLVPNSFVIANATTAKTDTTFMVAFHNLLEEYQTEITIVLSFGMLLSIAIFIYHCVQLSNNADNPTGRKQTINNLLITGFCLAAQGGVTTILSIIYFAFG